MTKTKKQLEREKRKEQEKADRLHRERSIRLWRFIDRLYGGRG